MRRRSLCRAPTSICRPSSLKLVEHFGPARAHERTNLAWLRTHMTEDDVISSEGEAEFATTLELAGGQATATAFYQQQHQQQGMAVDIPDFDDSLIPEALDILGFDLETVPSLSAGGFAAALGMGGLGSTYDIGNSGIGVFGTGLDAEAGGIPKTSTTTTTTTSNDAGSRGQSGGLGGQGGTNSPPIDDDGDETKRRRTTGGSNQREVQRRYRERKKERTKELEQQVEILQARLNELESGAAAKHHAGVAYADGSEMSTCTAAAAEQQSLDEHAAVRQFEDGVKRLKILLERGASDGELRSTLSKMCGHVCTRLLTPESNFGRAMMHRHARVLNEANERDGGSGEMVVCGSVRGGFLKANPSANPEGSDALWTLSAEEARLHWQSVVDRFEDVVPPSEVNKLVEWRNKYVAGLSDIYKRRQDLGMQLAFTGPSVIGAGGAGAGAAAAAAGGGGRTGVAPLGTLPLLPTHPAGPPNGSASNVDGVGGAEVTAAAVRGATHVTGLDSFKAHSDMFTDTMSVIDALKASVADELKFKHVNTSELIGGVVQARTAAHVAILSFPLLPDPLAVASEIIRRRHTRQQALTV